MTNAKQRVENIEYTITQANKLLNDNDKKSEAYAKVQKEIQGLKSTLRVAKNALKKEIKDLKRAIKLSKMQLKASPHVTEKLKVKKELDKLEAALKQLL